MPRGTRPSTTRASCRMCSVGQTKKGPAHVERRATLPLAPYAVPRRVADAGHGASVCAERVPAVVGRWPGRRGDEGGPAYPDAARRRRPRARGPGRPTGERAPRSECARPRARGPDSLRRAEHGAGRACVVRRSMVAVQRSAQLPVGDDRYTTRRASVCGTDVSGRLGDAPPARRRHGAAVHLSRMAATRGRAGLAPDRHPQRACGAVPRARHVGLCRPQRRAWVCACHFVGHTRRGACG